MVDSSAIVIFHKDHALDPTGANGGAETATIALAQTLSKLGKEVYLAAELRGSHLSDGIVVNGVHYCDLGAQFDTTSIFKRFADRPIHIIVACKAQALLESRGYSNVLTRIFVTHEPSANGLGLRPEIIGEVADRVVCVSNSQKALLVAAGCREEKIIVIPNGVDQEKFSAVPPETRNYDRLMFAGALVVDKGLHLLIEAFASLKQRYPRLALDVYGTAAMWGRDNYFDVEHVKKSVPDIKFHGAVPPDQIARAMQSAGLLIQPSIYFESFSLTTLEAQVTGLPVIGSSNGGMSEIILDGETGLLLAPSSSTQLAEAIEGLLSSPETLRRMSKNAIEQIRPKYSWEKTARAFISLLNSGNKHIDSRSEMKQSPKDKPPDGINIGIVTTYNQQCGLATYARYLTAAMTEPVTILAEDVPASERIAEDGTTVRRCWKRGAADYSALMNAIKEEGISLLYLNCHYRFFVFPEFADFLSSCRARGITIVSHIHNPYTIDATLAELIACSDRIIVHTPENRLEVIANGAAPETTFVLEHGIQPSTVTRTKARQALEIPQAEHVVVCFGFIQPHKGIDEVVTAMPELLARVPSVVLYVVGGPHQEDPHSQEYLAALKQFVKSNGLNSSVKFIEGFVGEQEVEAYLASADAIVMNYRSNYYEASGAVSLALASGAPVICSLAPAFARLGENVFHLTGGFPMAQALELVLTNKTVADTLRKNASCWVKEHSWSKVCQQLESFLAAIPRKDSALAADRAEANVPSRGIARGRALRILMMNRPTAFSHRGGDTVVMERVSDELRHYGIVVDIDLEGSRNPKDYDLVHLHNFATPEITEAQARRAIECKTPYVVTTLYEDLPRFYHQMVLHYQAIRGYVENGQQVHLWPEYLKQAKNVTPCARWENTWTANNAAALLAGGTNERDALLRDYPNAARIELFSIGSDLVSANVSDCFFREKFGIADYVLCVGRLETRKNQLSLLKALEDSDIPIVFATSGFTYQPEYAAVCRAFRRKGKTIFVERLSDSELWAAYRGARVHALPSWYELPGMVSVEAARAGTPVVVTDYGTIRDYLGTEAHYCDPGEPQTIQNAVFAAYYGPRNINLAEKVKSYTWKRAAEQIGSIYERVMETPTKSTRSAYSLPEWDNHSNEQLIAQSLEAVTERTTEATSKVAQIAVQAEVLPTSFEKTRAISLCEEADGHLRASDRNGAERSYLQAIELAPECGRAHRGLGIMALHDLRYTEAEGHFRQALSIQANDSKALAGLASCIWENGDKERAFEMYYQAFKYDPTHSGVLLHIVSAAYTLNRLDELKCCLLEYLSQRPEDFKLRYCLAGCYYKRGEYELAEREVNQILTQRPEHAESAELKEMLRDKVTIKAGVVRSFDDKNEDRLRELETMKEEKRFLELAQAADDLLREQSLSNDQQAYAKVLRAEAWIMIGRADDAEQELSTLSFGNRWASRAISARGVIAASREAWETAQGLFQDALITNPENDVALAGLGIVSMKLGRLQLAWDYFERALKANPENLRAITGLVQVGYPLQRHRELEVALHSYLELHPANLNILYSYAGCLYSQKRIAEAKSQLEKIVLFDPEHAFAKELLQKIEGEQGTHSGGRVF